MTKIIRPALLSIVLLASACGGGSGAAGTTGSAGRGGSSAAGTGGGTSGATGTAGGSGTTGTAGSGASGTTGSAGSGGTGGTTGSAGSGASGTTGSAGSGGGAGTTGVAGNDAGTGSDAPTQTDGGATTTNIKAATGGTIMAAGLILEIPAGALAADTDITVAVSDGTGLPAASTLVSSVYDLGPNGTTFTKPVKLTINVDATKLGTRNPVVSYLATGAWVALSDSVAAAGGKVVANTTHFTPFGVIGSDAAACIAMAKTACQSCCKTTFATGAAAPLALAIKACACTAGAPCETACAGNACASMAATTDCQTCLNTVGSANPQSACITASQQACTTDPDCMRYTSCQVSCTNNPPVDAGTTDAATDAPPACTVSFTNTAPIYMNTSVAATRPAPTGGTIVPGIYWLTEDRTYTGPGGATGSTAANYSETFQITATEWDAAITVGTTNLALKTTYTLSGTTFTPTRVCPSGDPLAALSYSVIGNEIHFTTLAGTSNTERILVRQP